MRQFAYFGGYGGVFVPEILVPALEELEGAFLDAMRDPAFQEELSALLRDYAGRPTPLYACRNLVSELRRDADRDAASRVWLKREDLLHGGAHKTNQALGQGLIARRLGKRRLIAETGAGQHGVATALTAAVLGMQATIYMGEEDVRRQAPNVARMRLMGAEVVSVDRGARTLKDAINEALRDWSATYETTHYLLGTVAGPHPFPLMVRELQRVIGREARAQFLERCGRLPDVVVACVGGGSNAIGIFSDFLEDDPVRLVGVEPAGRGLDTEHHGATLLRGRAGVLHGARTMLLQDDEGQIRASHSIAAGLDYPGVGPEHARLKESGRVEYTACRDDEAVEAFTLLARAEGILPALESAHALAEAMRIARWADRPLEILVSLSGRGDKDLDTVASWLSRGGKPEGGAGGTAAPAGGRP